MKYSLFTCSLLVCFLFIQCNSKYVEIPDATFKTYLVEHFDTDKDNEISYEEAKKITHIRLSFQHDDFTSAKGIEACINLEDLRVIFNKLTNLDVSKNTKLKHLECTSNKLTSLDITNNPQLEKLWCANNKISSLNISKNPMS